MENTMRILSESLSFFNMWQTVGVILTLVGSLTLVYFGIYLFKRASKAFWTGNKFRF